ncbi:MAG: class I SAM-dependent methyltransferase [Oscillospiraceae bacterium]|nr:class I SAM-dependent methyltransferase [Oscillospiraceae bacterium]
MPDIYTDVKTHYDKLIAEGNDPIHDSESLKLYMDKWDGPQFIEDMQLSGNETVLEIGVGTGRLAIKTCEKCRCFYGIDISQKTIEAAKKNLPADSSIHLICDDYLTWETSLVFDVIYSSLTFLHIKDKNQAIDKTYSMLAEKGRFVLSIEKNQNSEIDYGTRKLRTYPDNADTIERLLKESGFSIIKQYSTEFADIFVSEK